MLNPQVTSDFELLMTTRALRWLRARGGAEDKVLVAGSMSHQVPFVNDSKGGVTAERYRRLSSGAEFEEMANRLASNGVDFILLEMMSQPDLPTSRLRRSRHRVALLGRIYRGHDDELNVFAQLARPTGVTDVRQHRLRGR